MPEARDSHYPRPQPASGLAGERIERIPSHAEAFLNAFQYTFGFLDRVPFGDAIFLKAVHSLHVSLTELLATHPEVVLRAREGRVYLNETALPDSYVLQRLFVRFHCPALRLRKGILLHDLLQCVRQVESLLRRELAPTRMMTPRNLDVHYEWIPENSN